jgi:predicted PhzF superfamily epimerase YddE/YHI9
VTREGDGTFTLDFPADPPVPVAEPPAAIFEGLNIPPVPVWKGRFDYLVELGNEASVMALQPDFRKLAQTPSRGVIVTAPGTSSDFVSRCFFPQAGIDEDPVTGSAHCLLTPFWAERSGRDRLSAIQVSARQGWLDCRLVGDRVQMGGHAAIYLKGEIRF